MLYSHNLESEKIDLFSLFLNKALHGDSDYKEMVDGVILETNQYAKGVKDLYNINKDLMNIILMLADSEHDYFVALDNPQQYNNETYEKILGILSHSQQQPMV